jgi:hypothetical protein
VFASVMVIPDWLDAGTRASGHALIEIRKAPDGVMISARDYRLRQEESVIARLVLMGRPEGGTE